MNKVAEAPKRSELWLIRILDNAVEVQEALGVTSKQPANHSSQRVGARVPRRLVVTTLVCS
jgi:hypothetical protein